MAKLLNERFGCIPEIVAGSNTQYSEATVATEACPKSRVNVPNKPPSGLTYRYKLGGTKSGANVAHTVLLVLGGTTVMTLTADDATAVDWVAEFTIRFTDPKNQKVMGHMISNTTDGESDYAAGTVNCTAGAVLEVKITNGHTSDTTTLEMLTCEKWVF